MARIFTASALSAGTWMRGLVPPWDKPGSLTQESNRMELVWLSHLVQKGHTSLEMLPDFLNVGEKEPSILRKELSRLIQLLNTQTWSQVSLIPQRTEQSTFVSVTWGFFHLRSCFPEHNTNFFLKSNTMNNFLPTAATSESYLRILKK